MIVKNVVYQFVADYKRIRIIYVSNQENICAYVNIEADLATPILDSITAFEKYIELNELVEIIDPFCELIEEKNLSKVVKTKRDKNWNVIKEYWDSKTVELINSSTRMALFREIANKYEISLMTVRRMFSRFWQRGMTKNACLLDYSNSGAPGREKHFNVKTGRPRIDLTKGEALGLNVDDQIKKQFEIVINKYFRTKALKTLSAVYTQLLEDFYAVPIKENGETRRILKNVSNIPTIGQFYYWYNKNKNKGIDIKKRLGDKNYELTSRPILGDSRMEAPGPGFRYQIDATPDNTYIVSETDRNKIIGRSIIYAIIDVYSRLITGIYVGLESNSWNGAMMALDSMVADKVELCAQHGISIDNESWPSSHLPEVIIADRGEMKGHGVENLINNFKVAIENTPSYRGDLKGIVERLFRTITEKTKTFLPGGIIKDYRKRGDADYRLEAKLTLKEIRKIVFLAVLEHNLGPIDGYTLTPNMIRDNVRPIPLEIWNWGIANQKGCLRKVDQLTFRLGILPRDTAVITRGAVVFNKLHYSASELLVDYNHLNFAEKNVEVIFDPQNLRYIYMVKPEGGYILLNLLDKDKAYASFSLEDVIETNKKAAALKRSADDDQTKIAVQYDQEIRKVAKNAVEEFKMQEDKGLSKSQRLKDIRENRAKEKAVQREKESLLAPIIDNTNSADILPFVDSDNDLNIEKDNLTAKETMIDLIRRRRNERRKE